MINLLQFRHNRKESFKKSCDDLRDIIDDFAEQKELDSWYLYFENHYSLPREVIVQQMKSYLVSQYNFQKGAFHKKLFFWSIIKTLPRHFLILIYLFFRAKRYFSKRTYDLIVEWIENKGELDRFSKLVNLFGKKKVLIIAVNPLVEPAYEIIYRPLYKKYDLSEVGHSFLKEMLYGLKLYIKLSVKLKINLIQVTSYLINQYLYYYSIFKYNRAKYCIQERHYQTSAIKNHLFHVFGGKYSTSIQKNVVQRGHNGFYYDLDVFFSLGQKSAERAFEYGARIKEVVPVGSLFMEYYWFEKNKEHNNGEQGRTVVNPNNYDIVFLGINVSMALFYVDAYDAFLDDYYETFQWLVDFSKKNPHLRIGIKHHKNNRIDEREMKIIKNTEIKRIDNNKNSYEEAFQSRCIVTFGSTMGYELLTHGRPAIFLDPDGRCALLPDKTEVSIRPFRAFDYQEFTEKVTKILSGLALSAENFYKDDFCLPSDQVSTKIYSFLTNTKKDSYE